MIIFVLMPEVVASDCIYRLTDTPKPHDIVFTTTECLEFLSYMFWYIKQINTGSW